ncbi:hypothetical protein R3P38DRAFT_3222974 [Favolaschia claudopus]|uniref:Uncharacterized protein n=1 Tax=Favolaschia claudopus TaxID=2862362 RepID=A0AAV9ZY59_9AGAR
MYAPGAKFIGTTELMKKGGESSPRGFHWDRTDDGHRVEDSSSWRILQGADASRTTSLIQEGCMERAVHRDLFARAHHDRLAIHHVDAATDESDSQAASPVIVANAHIRTLRCPCAGELVFISALLATS